MRLLLATTLALLTLLAPATARAQLTIYSSLPLQGDARPQSRSVVQGMRLALADRGGRAGGQEITYVSLDDATRRSGKWEPGEVRANARRAAGDPSTIAYLGEFNSGASAISIPILNQAGIAQISPSNTYVGLTRPSEPGEPGKYYPTGVRTYARVIPADHIQAEAVLAYARSVGVRRLAIANDLEVYGYGIADLVRRRASAYGIRAINVGGLRASRSATRRRNLQRAAVRRARRGRADGFFYGGITQNYAVEVFSAFGRGLPKAKLFGPDGVAESPFTTRLPRRYRSRMHITNPTLDPKFYPPAAEDFFTRFRQTFDADPEPYAIYGYEAMALALDAIDRAANPTDRRAVVDALFATKDRASVLGTYSIDAMGDTTLPDYAGNRVTSSGLLMFDRVVTAIP